MKKKSLIKIENIVIYATKNFVIIKMMKKLKKSYKVRDHCHFKGKYRGAVHSKCNLKYKIPKEIPILFHSGSNYDYHFVIEPLAKE